MRQATEPQYTAARLRRYRITKDLGQQILVVIPFPPIFIVNNNSKQQLYAYMKCNTSPQHRVPFTRSWREVLEMGSHLGTYLLKSDGPSEFSMHAATALGVARRSQSKRHAAGNYPARAGASSSAEGTQHEPAPPRPWGASTRSRGGVEEKGYY